MYIFQTFKKTTTSCEVKGLFHEILKTKPKLSVETKNALSSLARSKTLT